MIGIFQLMVLLFAVLAIALPIFCLVDMTKRDFESSNKLLWVLIVLFFPLLGSVAYLVVGREQGRVR